VSAQPSQCDRVLAVLVDELPHDIHEIHERAGTMRLNSRISDLRKRGLRIDYWRERDRHFYRLVSLPEPSPILPGDGSGSEDASPMGGLAAAHPDRAAGEAAHSLSPVASPAPVAEAAEPEQLSLGAVA
jgi:hypothetical protein